MISINEAGINMLASKSLGSSKSLLFMMSQIIIIPNGVAKANSKHMRTMYLTFGFTGIGFICGLAIILAGGTGFICDLGMTGVLDSVIGVKKDIIIDFFTKPEKRHRFINATGEVWFNGCIFDIDEKTGKTLSVERLNFKEI